MVNKYQTMEKIKSQLALSQPYLKVNENGGKILIHGDLIINEREGEPNPQGPIDKFRVSICIPNDYPHTEPRVREIGGRIPILNNKQGNPDRHINPDSTCCICVFGAWIASSEDYSVVAYINGPIRDYFFGQHYFEKNNKWPFGEAAHGEKGLLDVYCNVLQIPSNGLICCPSRTKKSNKKYKQWAYEQKRIRIARTLRLLSQKYPKKHHLCPCGSKTRWRRCHKKELEYLRKKITLVQAKIIQKQFNQYNNNGGRG